MKFHLVRGSIRGAVCVGLGLLFSVGLVLPAASQIVIDDFEDYEVDSNINGQNGWTANATAGTVVVDPLNPGNKVLSVTGGAPRIYKPITPTIGVDTTATLFFRFMTDDFTAPDNAMRMDGSIGLSPTETPTGFDHFRPMVRPVSNNHTDPNAGDLTVRDGGNFPRVGDFSINTWYDVWVVMHHEPAQVPLYEVYIEGGAFTSQTKLVDGANSLFQYRTSPPAPEVLVNFFIAGGNSHVGPMYVDDIWIDPTSQNLGRISGGDVNGDEVVDILDFNIIRDNFQQAASREMGDLSGDGIVNLTDFRRWKVAAYPEAAAAAAGLGEAIPEPASAFLLLVAAICCGILRRPKTL